jgi:Flp pilus assembly protein TadG
MENTSTSFCHRIHNEKGQSFIEFIMLFVVLIGLSFGMLGTFNNGVAVRWKAMVETIVDQNPRVNLELR